MSTDWTVNACLDSVRKVLRDDLKMIPVGLSEWCEDIPRRGELWFLPGYGYTYLVGPVGGPECDVCFNGTNDRTFVAYCLFSRGFDIAPDYGPEIGDCPEYWRLNPPDMSLTEPRKGERTFCTLPPDALMTG
jgi:hypothetical protein